MLNVDEDCADDDDEVSFTLKWTKLRKDWTINEKSLNKRNTIKVVFHYILSSLNVWTAFGIDIYFKSFHNQWKKKHFNVIKKMSKTTYSYIRFALQYYVNATEHHITKTHISGYNLMSKL